MKIQKHQSLLLNITKTKKNKIENKIPLQGNFSFLDRRVILSFYCAVKIKIIIKIKIILKPL